MEKDFQKSKEILNSKLKMIADRNERFVIINDELEELRLLIREFLSQLILNSQIDSDSQKNTD